MALVRESPLAGWGHFYKRGLDLLGSAAGLALFAIPMALIAIGVRLSGSGPVIFRQERMSLNGQRFMLFKFRTMQHVQAEATPLQDMACGTEGWTLRNDHRVTPFGRFLRRTSLDELPQLINVLKGELSIVGPRPHALQAKAANQLYYEAVEGYFARHRVKPGITGLWQVLRLRDAGPSDFQEWIYYDVEYARHRSLWLDWQILLFTPLTMFAPRSLDRLANKLAARGICSDSGRNRPSHETQVPGSP